MIHVNVAVGMEIKAKKHTPTIKKCFCVKPFTPSAFVDVMILFLFRLTLKGFEQS